MADFVTGLRQVIQDLVAPDLKAIQAKQDATTHLIDAFRAEMRSEFAAQRLRLPQHGSTRANPA
jgi:hypothetical protein